MKRLLVLSLYYALFPLFLLICLPGYLIKMKRRGGFGTGLRERFGFYKQPASAEPKGGLYVHAVSVGEAMIGLKFIREWQKQHEGPVVLAVSTATGHEVVRKAALPGVRALYAPLDVLGLPERALTRFEPKAVALMEAELWPHFAEVCHRRQIPLLMLNARLSPRSEGRYAKVRGITSLMFSRLNGMGVQNERDAARFERIGVDPQIIRVTGSIKFDVLGDLQMKPRLDFASILERLSPQKAVVLAASTHAGEEALLAQAIDEAGAFPLIVPRHAERRGEVVRDLEQAGFIPLLRTAGDLPETLPAGKLCYVADTTGELRDWTQLAQAVIIGKSFYAKGGQNPVEAIAASVPVLCGPEMSNFADLVELLVEQGGIAQMQASDLSSRLRELLSNAPLREGQCQRALECLQVHSGATKRSVAFVQEFIA